MGRQKYAAVMAGLLNVIPIATMQAQEAAVAVVRGTDGLVRVPFQATNAGTEPITCGIAAAHWYSIDLGLAAPGEAVRRDLWASPPTGAVFWLNEQEDRIPVQSLWCGLAGRSWATRFLVTLDRRAGLTPLPIVLSCSTAEGDRLQCR